MSRRKESTRETQPREINKQESQLKNRSEERNPRFKNELRELICQKRDPAKTHLRKRDHEKWNPAKTHLRKRDHEKWNHAKIKIRGRN